jgi:hypothetical protein
MNEKGSRRLPFIIHHSSFIIPYNGIMNLDAALELLSERPSAPLDVAEIALCLARDEYPGLDV